jgi:hypothetical protein
MHPRARCLGRNYGHNRDPPDRENPRHMFVEKLFAETYIRIVPMNQVARFAEELRLRIQYMAGRSVGSL